MKRLWLFVMVLVCGLVLTGCTAANGEKDEQITDFQPAGEMNLHFDISGAAKIELQSGLDGTVVEITDEADMEHITDNINALKFSKDRAVDGSGWSYRLRWYDENDSMIEEIVVMSEYVIDYQDYFYNGMEADHEIDIAFFDTLLDKAREAALEQEEHKTLTGFISDIYPDTNSLYVRTDPELGFSHAYAVIVYLPDDISAADQIQTSWVRITYSGEPEIVEPNNENGYEETTAIFQPEQIVDFLDYFVE